MIAEAISDAVGLPRDAVAPRALAAAIVATLLALEQRFAEARESDAAAEFDGVLPMVRAALAALHDRG